MVSSSQLLKNLELVSETPISIQAQLLTPDVTYAVAISSTGEEECSTPTSLPLTGIVAGISVCIAVLILIVTLVVVVILSNVASSSFKLQGDLKLL